MSCGASPRRVYPDARMTRPRHLTRIAAATIASCLLLTVTGCFGSDDDPDAATCSKSTLLLRVVAGPPADPVDPAADPAEADPAVEGEGETTTTAVPVDGDASVIEPGSTVEATGARLDDRCDDDEAGEPLTALRLAVVQGDVDLNVAGADADEDGSLVVTFGLPENLPAGPAEIVVRGSGDDADVLAKASFEVAPTS